MPIQFAYIAAENEFWKRDNSRNYIFSGWPIYDETDPIMTLEDIGQDRQSPFDTRVYDNIEEETEDDLLAPHPASALYV